MKIRKSEVRCAGLPFAVIDPDSKEYIAAEEAISGEKYYCPGCGCRMHVTTSRCGKRYFARNAGEQHTKKQCGIYEGLDVWRTFDGLEPEIFIRTMCLAILRRGGRTVSGPHNKDGNDSVGVDDDSDIRILPFQNLRQIAGGMLGFYDGKTADGKHRISDFLISYRYAHNVICGDHYEMGARIIHCRYKTFHEQSRSLMFKLFHKKTKNDLNDFEVRFRLTFADDSLYRYYKERLVEESVSEGGRCQTDDKKMQDALIASDNWVLSRKPNCIKKCGMKQCGCCYGLYQAVITSANQIYLMPQKSDTLSDTARGC